MRANSPPPDPSRGNIEAIAKLEHDALHRRTFTERASESIAKFIGSVTFLLLNALLILVWGLLNFKWIPGSKAFDPFPFGILALMVSTESVVLTIFVLISQNRLLRQSEKRAHLDLQVGLLAEQELTAVLQMLHQLCEHAGVKTDYARHSDTFATATDVHKIASELEDKLPGS